jgi:transcriptional regulator, tetR family
MTQNESKYYNTACLMDEALIQLINEKDYDYITITEICKRAGVNRSTFYLHYETVDDLLKEAIKKIDDDFNSHMQGFGTNRDLIIDAINNERTYELNFINENIYILILIILRSIKKSIVYHSKIRKF